MAKTLDERIEDAENEVYAEKVVGRPSGNVSLSFADGFIHGQISMRKFYKSLIENHE